MPTGHMGASWGGHGAYAYIWLPTGPKHGKNQPQAIWDTTYKIVFQQLTGWRNDYRLKQLTTGETKLTFPKQGIWTYDSIGVMSKQ